MGRAAVDWGDVNSRAETNIFQYGYVDKLLNNLLFICRRKDLKDTLHFDRNQLGLRLENKMCTFLKEIFNLKSANVAYLGYESIS